MSKKNELIHNILTSVRGRSNKTNDPNKYSQTKDENLVTTRTTSTAQYTVVVFLWTQYKKWKCYNSDSNPKESTNKSDKA